MKHRKKEGVNTARVKVRFGIYAKKLDFDMISEMLNMKPTNIMLAENIKIIDFQEDGWEYISGYEESTDINIQIEKAILPFLDKIAYIKDISIIFNANIQISVLIRAKSRKFYPYLALTGKNIKHMSELNVDLFDIDIF